MLLDSCHSEERSDVGIRNQKVGNVLILVSFRNGLPRRPVGPPYPFCPFGTFPLDKGNRPFTREPALSVSCADSSPTGGAKLGLSGPHRPLPPPLGEVPPQGAERASPAKKKSPGGGLGIDFFPYHVILKIKRGAAGRREPLGLTEVTVSVLG